MENQPRVVIVGGGIAGLTSAHLLAERGFKVTVVELFPACGGKAKSKRINGYPVEHSPRVYGLRSHHLKKLLGLIPYNENSKLLDNLTTPSLALSYFKYRTFKFNTLMKRPRWSKTNFIAYPLIFLGVGLVNFYRIIRMAIIGPLHLLAIKTPMTELLDWVLKHYYLAFACDERARRLINVTYGDYLQLEKKSNEYKHYLFPWAGIIAAGHEDSEAYFSVATTLRTILLDNALFLGFAHDMMNGPTSERFIDPWVRYLQSKGVEFLFNKEMIDATLENGAMKSVVLADGRKLEADYFILALSLVGMRKLLAESNFSKEMPDLKKSIYELPMEWSNGMQFFLRDFPKDTENHKIGQLTVNQDSPWECLSIIQAEGFWKDIPLPEGCKCVISGAFSNHMTPGTVTGKPFVECTMDEIKEELLKQINFTEKELIIDWKLDYELDLMDEAEYQKVKKTLPGHISHQRKDGKRFIDYTPLYVPKVGTDFHVVTTETTLSNVFLASEYVKTEIPIPTMEKACESGHRAAKALVASSPFKDKVDPVELLDNGISHFKWVRKLDAYFYNKRKKN